MACEDILFELFFDRFCFQSYLTMGGTNAWEKSIVFLDIQRRC